MDREQAGGGALKGGCGRADRERTKVAEPGRGGAAEAAAAAALLLRGGAACRTSARRRSASTSCNPSRHAARLHRERETEVDGARACSNCRLFVRSSRIATAALALCSRTAHCRAVARRDYTHGRSAPHYLLPERPDFAVRSLQIALRLHTSSLLAEYEQVGECDDGRLVSL